jgi:hypothetical protein
MAARATGRLTASEARKVFFDLLDAAEKGDEVLIERKGVRFRLAVDKPGPRKARRSPLRVEDPALLSGQWTWVPDKNGQLGVEVRKDEP